MKAKLMPSLISGLTISISWIGYTSFESYVLGNCDSKFGCYGGVVIAAFISGIASIESAIAFFLVTYLPKLNDHGRIKRHRMVAAVFGGLILTFILPTIGRWNLEEGGMIFSWFFLSALLFTLILLALKGLRVDVT